MEERIEYLEKILKATTPRRNVNQAILAVIGGTLLFRSGYDFAMKNSPRITVSQNPEPIVEKPYNLQERIHDLEEKLRLAHDTYVEVYSYHSVREIPDTATLSTLSMEQYENKYGDNGYIGIHSNQKNPNVFYLNQSIPLKTPSGYLIEPGPSFNFDEKQFDSFLQNIPEGNWGVREFLTHDNIDSLYSDRWGSVSTLIPADHLPEDNFVLLISRRKNGQWKQQSYAYGENVILGSISPSERRREKYIFISHWTPNPIYYGAESDKLAILVLDIKGQALEKKILDFPHLPSF